MAEKRRRGRPKKESVLPKRVHSNISEEHQAKLEELLERHPDLITHELMEIGIDFMYDSIVNGF